MICINSVFRDRQLYSIYHDRQDGGALFLQGGDDEDISVLAFRCKIYFA